MCCFIISLIVIIVGFGVLFWYSVEGVKGRKFQICFVCMNGRCIQNTAAFHRRDIFNTFKASQHFLLNFKCKSLKKINGQKLNKTGTKEGNGTNQHKNDLEFCWLKLGCE